jgi:hypothetical protein
VSRVISRLGVPPTQPTTRLPQVAWGLALVYIFVAAGATVAWSVLRVLGLRAPAAALVGAGSYAALPWGVWSGLLHHRRLPAAMETGQYTGVL